MLDTAAVGATIAEAYIDMLTSAITVYHHLDLKTQASRATVGKKCCK
jgi:hypothetical protein